MEVVGRLFGLFSFDVGYEIDLARVRQEAPGATAGGFSHRKAAPASLAYASPPLVLRLPPEEPSDGKQASAVIHDFGAITIQLESRLRCELAELSSLTARLTTTAPLEAEARRLLETLVARIAPAITRRADGPFVEDYYVVQLDEPPPGLSIPELVALERGALASALRCEPHALSNAEIADVFSSAITYYPEDLLVADWNVALIVDRDFADALTVLEFLNVQLLELRFYDFLLDRRVAAGLAMQDRPRRATAFLYGRYHRAIDELAAIRVDVTAVVERIHGALKIGGSLYLAKVYRAACERLGLESWEEDVARKLDVLEKVYEILVQRATVARTEALEVTVIVLIAVEILLFLVGKA
jgi:hypothetical protein